MNGTLRAAVVVLMATCAIVAPSAAGGATPDPNVVGLVTDIGGLNDRSFNYFAYQGLERAQSQLGTSSIVLESRGDADYAANLSSLTRSGSGLVFGIGFLMGDAVKEVAAAQPATNFAIVDYSYEGRTAGSWDATSNVAGITFNDRQAGYIAGALAGTVERNRALAGMNRARVVSAIGGMDIPPVTRYLGGFRDGVHRTCRDCRVLMAFSNDFVDQAKCRRLARAQLRRGSDIVFVAAGQCGMGALDEVRSRGVWGVGVDADQAYLGGHILTSAVKRVDVAVYDMIERSRAGTFPGGRATMYGVSQGAVGIGTIVPSARRFQFAANAAIRDLKRGTVR